jgi:hypothetical protein
MNARVTGSNGWPVLLECLGATELLMSQDSPTAASVAGASDSEWLMVTDPAAVLAETAAISAMVHRALASACVVATGSSEFGEVLSLIELGRILRARIASLVATGDMQGARAEALKLVKLATRIDTSTATATWVSQQVHRKGILEWLAAQLPRLAPTEEFVAEVEASIGAETEFRRALEAELAMLLERANEWVLDHEPAEIQEMFRDGNSHFADAAEYIKTYPPPIRAATAALSAIKQHPGLDDAATVRALVDAVEPWQKDRAPGTLQVKQIRSWAALVLRARAAELALRLRCNPGTAPVLLQVARFAVFDVREDASIEIRAKADAAILSEARVEADEPLVRFATVPAAEEPVVAPEPDGREFR